MQNPSFNWLPVVLLVGIAGATFWLERAAQQDTDAHSKTQDGVDFWAERFTLRRFGPAGTLQSTLTASQLTHDGVSDSSIVIAPKLVYANDKQTTITAAEAVARHDGSQIELIKDVAIDRPAQAGGQGALSIRSARMTVFPEREQAKGDVPVRVERPTGVITADRFKTDHKSGVTILEGHVRAKMQRNDS